MYVAARLAFKYVQDWGQLAVPAFGSCGRGPSSAASMHTGAQCRSQASAWASTSGRERCRQYAYTRSAQREEKPGSSAVC